MQEIWNEWRALENLPTRLYLEYLKDAYDGLTLAFKDEEQNSKYLIVFFDSAISYRSHDEGDLLKTLNEANKKSVFPFFRIENSHYLDWFNKESFNIHENDEIVHYVFATPNDVIDVLSTYPPEFKWVDNI